MESKNEMSLIAAIAVLFGVSILLWFFSLNAGLGESFKVIGGYLKVKGGVFGFVLLKVAAIYLISIFWILGAIGFNEFGQKISHFSENKRKKKSVLYFLAVSCGFLVGWYLSHYYSLYSWLEPFPSIIPKAHLEILKNIVSIYQGLFMSLIVIFGYWFFEKMNFIRFGNIDEVPTDRNKLIIGTKIEDNTESWIALGPKSLATGIMTTASTGSGKSSACLLPWTKQILTNFDPKPSLIVIDPKDSFARDVLKLTKKLKLEDRVIHFTNDMRFRTNVIYEKNVLKESGYSRVASKIQAANENFIGKSSGDMKFWSTKGYSLIKNMVIFCGGKFGDYFTLSDFYETLIQSIDRDFGLEIEEFLATKDYDWEEKENLRLARMYFDYEYSKLDAKLKDSIVQSATTFLSLLRDARIEKIFCPAKEEVNFWGFDEIVDQGKIFIFGIDVPGLSSPMALLMKIMYQRSVMSRINQPERLKSGRLSFGIYDEYQSIVSVGGGQIEGDDDYAAKRREALGVTIVATQSLSSLAQAIGNDTALDTLVQNFRNQIIGHSKDKRTVEYCKYFAGEVEKVVESKSYSESGSKPLKNIFNGLLTTSKPTVSQSLNQNVQKVPRITGETLSNLKSNEAVGFFFNGVDSFFVEKIGLKPLYLKTMKITHKKVLELTRKAAAVCLILFFVPKSFGFPTVCSAVKSPSFTSCMQHTTSGCMCGTPPRPCASHSYYFPQSFIEVTTAPQKSFFMGMPGAALQLGSAIESVTGFGGEEMGSYFFQARVIQVPLSAVAYQGMACGGNQMEKMCFDAISEHIESWRTGVADLKQPLFLAWKAAIPACFKKGMVSAAATGDVPAAFGPGSPGCGFPLKGLNMFPPTTADICGGWGVLLPRTGFVESSSTMGAALLAAKRIKSIASEVYKTMPSSPDEKWSLVYPNSSSCFREGKSLGEIEVIKQGNERGRLLGKDHQTFLFAIWKRVSCCKDVQSVATTEASKVALVSMCQGAE
tara:strand:+ start:19131 stop:22106 length:2976 start_codon:yes stop_codon:yes gene_type:complete